MTNERELLALAAKAYGIELNGAAMQPCYMDDGQWVLWNPAHGDGDSDRLGTAIEADVSWLSNRVKVTCWKTDTTIECFEYFKNHNGDKQKALRWARLRCAAEIGRALKD